MKAGVTVTYCNAGSGCMAAVVLAVVGTGDSGAKRLDFALSDALGALDVPHEQDAAPGASFWTLHDPARHAETPGLMTGEPITPQAIEGEAPADLALPHVPHGASQ